MQIAIQGKTGEFAFECTHGEPILRAGLRQGIGLPYECATGTCGTCRARIMSGEFDIGWGQAPGLARLKPERGDVLMCQARAHTDCLVRVPAQIETFRGPLPDRRRAILSELRRLTADVAHFELSLSSPMRFEAGQFVILEAAGVSGGRAYSMVNFGPELDRIAFVLKRKPGGGFGDWLFEKAAQGSELAVFGPLGRAVFRPEEDKDILCIAGGSGIAGMMAILERAVRDDYFARHRGYIFFGIRTLADCFYLEELGQYAAASKGQLEVTLALSDEAATSSRHEREPALGLASGFVHEVAAQAMAGRYGNAIAYVAGPPPMVDGALRVLIAQAGLSAQQIRYDKFS
jgi:toluene monooxygenase electron transfer component